MRIHSQAKISHREDFCWATKGRRIRLETIPRVRLYPEHCPSKARAKPEHTFYPRLASMSEPHARAYISSASHQHGRAWPSASTAGVPQRCRAYIHESVQSLSGNRMNMGSVHAALGAGGHRGFRAKRSEGVGAKNGRVSSCAGRRTRRAPFFPRCLSVTQRGPLDGLHRVLGYRGSRNRLDALYESPRREFVFEKFKIHFCGNRTRFRVTALK